MTCEHSKISGAIEEAAQEHAKATGDEWSSSDFVAGARFGMELGISKERKRALVLVKALQFYDDYFQGRGTCLDKGRRAKEALEIFSVSTKAASEPYERS
jgi:hypothetical protein